MKSSSNVLQNRRMPQYIGQIGRNRPIDAFNLHQRSGLNASHRTVMVKSRPLNRGWSTRMFRKICALKTRRFVTVGSPSGGLDEAFKRCVIKRFESPPLDLDPTRQILPQD